ncbi:hypothetical protein COW36_00900 [bacterium (Candidatus Blackallbacteria) CG17_big_fil_post_rev_8_21_14_2_50_48_46]|uniref:Glycoside hydrolase family 2 catalytic domain-containing protein n=1 Tax=bacterium (Candidatus Blackallbacteria) CG17_big_fil_post_rev_8_21_14_2_50_48_46 TaxID=2014261 RepID=A0A2M7GB88_9BACT|nr:MAG: hypothetical protein COW64_10275 [bacterium (Candidatus Blackallbacteria) CG18_big_fil_WC_8_21_14_2_50_49_26]PIW19427.1 MAG: hypothetical protein COW36_00900 [bacterium (Candidatus Blackallbacteria) CG17_big_fil_post_rev_8_21_14_2_50_48_46]PIW48969.1 MAG: hypothetical protein COW20_07555 [bacterium (Candidatus Blackallbacteria) CG13_big_fil_rev_8_21_14_2_50_49_14]
MPISQKLLITALLIGSLSACQAVDNLLVGIGGPPKNQTPSRSTSTSASEKFSYPDLYPVPYSAKDRQFLARWNGQSYENFYIKGINLGIGLPGTQAGDLAATREQFARWFKRMGELGFNSLRVYTLHFPIFYEELARYNAAHADHPIYLFHGVWLDEVEQAHDLYATTSQFDAGMQEVVNAVHGQGTIATRQGRAFGTYTADISRWIMGWIIGREVSPDEILMTDQKHADKTSYSGKNVKIKGTASEVWWTERIDRLMEFERNTYHVDRPISVSSWPTLDPLKHPTENSQYSQEDIAQIDLGKIELLNAPAGYFASYHAYPYYPDFMNDSPEYLKYSDSEGVNNYIGYLKALKAHYPKMPLVIAEYGVPSSWGNAHYSPSGMHHGGHDEEAQGRYNARLSKDIHENGLAGGMVFAWIDEWWKRTWIVDERSMPRDHYRFWHNLTSPEENFGMIAFDVETPPTQALAEGKGRIQSVKTSADATFFHIRLELNSPLTPQEELVIGVDTYRDDLGEVILPNGVRTVRRNEFALRIQGNERAHWLVTQPYDLVGIWHNSSGPQQMYQSRPTEGAPWMPVRWKNGQEHVSTDGSLTFPNTFFPIGELQLRLPGKPQSSKDAVFLNGNSVEIRLPWTLLQFTDPTTLTVTHDDRATKGVRETAPSEGIGLSVSLGSELLETARYRWAPWSTAPAVQEREKTGVHFLAETLKSIPDQP